MSVAATQPVALRKFEQRDIVSCGRICYEAFRNIAERHGFPPDLPSPEVGASIMETLLGNPGFYGIVAERDGVVLGSNWLDERNVIAGVGPITIDPAQQSVGVGRQLMQAVIDRSDERGFPGVRLVQAAYHARSLSLYTKLSFSSREELAVMDGTPSDPPMTDYTVRAAEVTDLAACNTLCDAVHGFHRGVELRDAISSKNAFVAEHDGAIRAYTSGLGFFGHSIGETTEAICALLVAAPRLPSLGVLVPIRNYPLFRWCLDHGMRVVLTMTLMSRGIFQQPDGPYLPSVLY
jgi:GNAT superfamily N-acetyltransferase